jgi:hypothetical protein
MASKRELEAKIRFLRRVLGDKFRASIPMHGGGPGQPPLKFDYGYSEGVVVVRPWDAAAHSPAASPGPREEP